MTVHRRLRLKTATGAALLVAGLGSCSSSVPPAVQSNTVPTELLNQLSHAVPDDDPRPSVAAPTLPATPVASAAPANANREPELLRRDVPETVVAGRTVAFGIDVVDAELDPVRVSLASPPAGVELDARTLTVRWHVPMHASGPQPLTVHIVERPGERDERSVDRTLSIQVAAHAPVARRPAVTAPLIPILVTVTSPEFLATAAHDWPITRVLEIARDAAIDALPPAEQPSIERRAGRDLFQDLLAQLAVVHRNPRLDPNATEFDRHFESARWRLVAVRPRVNKAIEELRLAYEPVDVAEPVTVMFRVRLFRGANPPSADVSHANDTEFTRLVHQAFYLGPRLRAGIAEGRAPAVSAAVANLVRRVLNFRDPQNALLRAGVAAIPVEARMGGGSTFDGDGRYVSGNAWAFSVANLRVDAAGEGGGHRTVHVVNSPISAFTFDVGENEAHDAFVSVCPPRYREGGAGNEPGMAALCTPEGQVRLREQDPQGRWVAARRDAMSEHREITTGEMVEHVGLRDPRRRNFEENGLTCVQCHMRDFDDGVLSEAQVHDPRVHAAITPARDVARVAMQILPIGVVPRSPWLIQQETFQLCDLGRKIHQQLALDVALPCPDGY